MQAGRQLAYRKKSQVKSVEISLTFLSLSSRLRPPASTQERTEVTALAIYKTTCDSKESVDLTTFVRLVPALESQVVFLSPPMSHDIAHCAAESCGKKGSCHRHQMHLRLQESSMNGPEMWITYLDWRHCQRNNYSEFVPEEQTKTSDIV